MPKISFVKGENSPDPSQSSILDMWVEHEGARVTEVPPNEPFEIHCAYKAVNTSPPLSGWSIAVTCVDVGTGGSLVLNYDDTRTWAPLQSVIEQGDINLSLNGQNIMPNQDITLRYKLWGKDVWPPDMLPPTTAW